MCGKLRYICECDAHAIIRRAKFGVWPLWGVILPEKGGLDPSLLDDPTSITVGFPLFKGGGDTLWLRPRLLLSWMFYDNNVCVLICRVIEGKQELLRE